MFLAITNSLHTYDKEYVLSKLTKKKLTSG